MANDKWSNNNENCLPTKVNSINSRKNLQI